MNKMLDETINTNINEIVLNGKGGFSADDKPDLPNITEAVPVTPEKILEIPKVREIVTEPPDSVEQNQGERKNILEIPKVDRKSVV